LLDEISEISPGLQAKLLRVLQEREFERVGGNKTLKVDVRVIATTNRNLLKSVEKGEFREDLYYRLNVLQIQVPPLRDRPEDIPILAEGFLNLFKRKHGLHLPGFTTAAMAALRAHPWPGNVRELQNCIERATILVAEGQPIDVPELNLQPGSARFSERQPSSAESAHKPDDPPNANLPQVGQTVSLASIERRHILEVLEQAGGNRTKAAQILDINVRTLRNKLQEYRIESSEGKEEGA
jgi:DNA-binding NtrC family response regulator